MSVAILENEAVRRNVSPLSVASYHALGRIGGIPEKTELLSGVVVEKMPVDPIHAGVLNRLFGVFSRSLPDLRRLRKENPLTLGDSEPMPDLALVDPDPRDYLDAHPRFAHLVVEVANTSVAIDRAKAAVYAAAGIPEYWLVNLNTREIEVHTHPRSGVYSQSRQVPADVALSPGAAPDVMVRLADLLA